MKEIEAYHRSKITPLLQKRERKSGLEEKKNGQVQFFLLHIFFQWKAFLGETCQIKEEDKSGLFSEKVGAMPWAARSIATILGGETGGRGPLASSEGSGPRQAR
jgi:hypothetical protein